MIMGNEIASNSKQPTQECCHPSEDGFLRLAEAFHRKDSAGKFQEFGTTAGDPQRGNLNAS